MMTTEHLLDAVKQLPKDERKKFLAKLAQLQMDEDNDSDQGGSDGLQNFLSLAGSINTGKVREPFPSREQLYDENW